MCVYPNVQLSQEYITFDRTFLEGILSKLDMDIARMNIL